MKRGHIALGQALHGQGNRLRRQPPCGQSHARPRRTQDLRWASNLRATRQHQGPQWRRPPPAGRPRRRPRARDAGPRPRGRQACWRLSRDRRESPAAGPRLRGPPYRTATPASQRAAPGPRQRPAANVLRPGSYALKHLGGMGKHTVVAERLWHGGDLVLDRLGDANGAQPLRCSLNATLSAGAGDRAAADHRDHGVNPGRAQRLQRVIGAINLVDLVLRGDRPDAKRIGACGGPDQAASAPRGVRNPRAEGHQAALAIALGVEQTIVAIADADDLYSEAVSRQRRARQHQVEARQQSAADIDGDFFVRGFITVLTLTPAEKNLPSFRPLSMVIALL